MAFEPRDAYHEELIQVAPADGQWMVFVLCLFQDAGVEPYPADLPVDVEPGIVENVLRPFFEGALEVEHHFLFLGLLGLRFHLVR